MNKSKLAASAAWIAVCLVAGVNPAGAQALPSPWASRDIGAPGLGGSATYASGVFDIDAAGTDVWSSSDQFHFVYQPVSGDVDIRARVDSLTTANEWSKAGVMIRNGLSANAAHAYALVSAGRGVAFQRRQTDGANSTSTPGTFSPAPHWVRLVRSGTTLTAFSSTDGMNWTTIATSTIELGATAYVGIAVTSHNPEVRTTANVSNVSMSSAALPAAQSSADIGNPAIDGSTKLVSGQYTITTGGIDIWGSADQFRYVYQPVTGNVNVTARVESIGAADPWSMAGVMVRESLAAGSRHAFAFVSSGKGYGVRHREDPNSRTALTSAGEGRIPGWVRLVRTGTLFEAFRSADGQTWVKMASETIDMSDTAYVGIAVTSHNATAATTAVVSALSITAAAAPSNALPAVILSSPAGGASFVAPASITMTAAASDADGTVASVEFYANSKMVGRDSAAPYSVALTSLPAGTYTLKAAATDDKGGVGVSQSVDVTVSASSSNTPPAVSLNSPANGTSLIAPASVTMTASASDADGTVASVDFYVNSTVVGSDTTAPYTFPLSSLAAGTYALKVAATDDTGAVTVSPSINIVVSAPTTTGSWSVNFLASADHSTLVTKYVLEIYKAGATPGTSTPVATSDLGKPTPTSTGDITVDRSTFFQGLAAGNYIATVAAIGSGGTGRSPSITFTR